MENNLDVGCASIVIGIALGVFLRAYFLNSVFEQECEQRENVYDCKMIYVPETPEATQ